MLILTIRTDKPQAEIGLFEDDKQVAYQSWQAHRQLAETIHQKIEDLLAGEGPGLSDLGGIVCFKGPGSFTGLRIGLATGNALAYGLNVPIVSEQGEDWIKKGIRRLQKAENEVVSLPEYGNPAHITQPKK